MTSPQRYELKFQLGPAGLARVLGWIATRVGPRPCYPARMVNSVYYDTADFSSARENLSGLAERTKYRLRWYQADGDAAITNPAFELKQRTGRVSAKQRLEVSPACGELLRSGGSHHEIRDALQRTWDEVDRAGRRLPHLLPALQVRYTREYFASAEGFRVTLDRDIRFHLAPLYATLNAGVGVRYPDAVLEIKFPLDLHDVVGRELRSLDLVPKRHSKYLAGLAAYGQMNYL